MDEMQFSWDARKATQNLQKQKVSFEEASAVYSDVNARLIHDPDHSNTEDRFVLTGLSSILRMLVVCHCYRKSEEKIRII
ncbi:MAG: BrnT family toxin [Planctomycetes bacterium]|nr:BrnT family toxin [Planctomycetota bacterium]